jgi:hypothetical protein
MPSSLLTQEIESAKMLCTTCFNILHRNFLVRWLGKSRRFLSHLCTTRFRTIDDRAIQTPLWTGEAGEEWPDGATGGSRSWPRRVLDSVQHCRLLGLVLSLVVSYPEH